MRIAVLGTGPVGQALAGKLAELGHGVAVGTRDPEATLARTEPDSLGNPPSRSGSRRTPRSPCKRRRRRRPRPS
jgi:prephenate dehydrogenase